LETELILTIPIWGDGSIIRDFIYINDLIEGILLASKKTTNSKIFNLGHGKGYSIKNIVTIIETTIKQSLAYEYLPPRLCDPPKIVLDISRAQNELGWNPSVEIEKGIKNTWDFISLL